MWSAQLLRARFAMLNLNWQAEPLEPRLFQDRPSVDAAVLMPLVQRPEGLNVLLTQRTAHLHDHSGQISFPGGRCEPEDDNPVETALRETLEETGLPRKFIEVLGILPIYQTATNFLVTPVVALVESGFNLVPDSFEVQEVFEVPLDFLLNVRNHQQRSLHTPQGMRQFYAMSYDSPLTGKNYFIWGATAAMLRNLHHFLGAKV